MAFLFIEKGCPILCGWVDEDESFTCTSVVEEIVLLKIRPSCSLIGFILFSLFFIASGLFLSTKNKMATSEKLYVFPLWAASPSMRPMLPGLAMKLPSRTKFERCCLILCELSRVSFPVSYEK